MTVQLFTRDHQLAALRSAWNLLSTGQPFRSWDWQVAWWRHYGKAPDRRLHILACYDGDELIGLLPCYRRLTALGRVLRPLASGEVCSEYLGPLAKPGRAQQVARELAQTLSVDKHASSPLAQGWDLMLLDAQDPADETLRALQESLSSLGHPIETRLGTACWRIQLDDDPTHEPGSPAYEQARFDSYLKQVARNHRHRLRKAERHGQQQGFTLHLAHDPASLERGFAILVDLHERRRSLIGEHSAFARRRFLAFHRDATHALLESGKLWLAWLQHGNTPISAYYCLADQGILHAYQSGLNPDFLDDEPGRVLLLLLLRRALRQGFSAIDLLRGNEPYKRHLAAEPLRSQTLLIGQRSLVGRAAFTLAQLRRCSRILAGQVLRQVRAP